MDLLQSDKQKIKKAELKKREYTREQIKAKPKGQTIKQVIGQVVIQNIFSATETTMQYIQVAERRPE